MMLSQMVQNGFKQRSTVVTTMHQRAILCFVGIMSARLLKHFQCYIRICGFIINYLFEKQEKNSKEQILAI